jgi:hypothetical protein
MPSRISCPDAKNKENECCCTEPEELLFIYVKLADERDKERERPRLHAQNHLHRGETMMCHTHTHYYHLPVLFVFSLVICSLIGL